MPLVKDGANPISALRFCQRSVWGNGAGKHKGKWMCSTAPAYIQQTFPTAVWPTPHTQRLKQTRWSWAQTDNSPRLRSDRESALRCHVRRVFIFFCVIVWLFCVEYCGAIGCDASPEYSSYFLAEPRHVLRPTYPVYCPVIFWLKPTASVLSLFSKINS